MPHLKMVFMRLYTYLILFQGMRQKIYSKQLCGDWPQKNRDYHDPKQVYYSSLTISGLSSQRDAGLNEQLLYLAGKKLSRLKELFPCFKTGKANPPNPLRRRGSLLSVLIYDRFQ